MASGENTESNTKPSGLRPAWQPGQSGNPGGRPKMPPEIKARLAELTPTAIDRLAEWMASDNPTASVQACRDILDRHYGKAAQSLSVTADVEATLIRVRLETGEVLELPSAPMLSSGDASDADSE